MINIVVDAASVIPQEVRQRWIRNPDDQSIGDTDADHAEEWERLAVREFESYFELCEGSADDL